jgi:RHS repeat-associated protein
LRDAFGADATVYQANGPTDYVPLDPGATLPFGRALWVHVPTARLVTLRGLARPVPPGEPATPGPLHAWPRPEGFVPVQDLESEPPFLVFDAATRRWLRRDPELPSFLNTAPGELGSAQTFWSAEAPRFRGGASASAVVYYHTDVVGSIAALTGDDGTLVEERAHYPYGAVRHLQRPGAALGGTQYDFTGHERDKESGLVHMGSRSYLDLAGVFLSPDPRFAKAAMLGAGSEADRESFASYVSNPQLGNLYGHALRNPLKYVDPSGREPELAEAAREDPNFQRVFAKYKGSPLGASLIQGIERHGAKILLRTGPVASGKEGGEGDAPAPRTRLDYYPKSKTLVVTVDIGAHLGHGLAKGYDQAIRSGAKDLFSELWKFHATQFEAEANDVVQQTMKEIEGIKTDRSFFPDDPRAQALYGERISEKYAQIKQIQAGLEYRQEGTVAAAEFESQLK